jgi:hypothetical protein
MDGRQQKLSTGGWFLAAAFSGFGLFLLSWFWLLSREGVILGLAAFLAGCLLFLGCAIVHFMRHGTMISIWEDVEP